MHDTACEIGKVIAVNPARREVRVKPYPDQLRQFSTERRWARFQPTGGQELRCRVNEVTRAGEVYRFQLGGGTPKDVVGKLKGCPMVLRPDECVAPTIEDYAPTELAGFQVVSEMGETVGIVNAAYETPAHPVLEIAKARGGGNLQVPAIPETIADIDFEQRTIAVHDITPYAVDDAD